MFIDTATFKHLAKFYMGELPADGIRFAISLFGNGKFSTSYKAQLIMKILYLDNLLEDEYITGKGWNAIQSKL